MMGRPIRLNLGCPTLSKSDAISELLKNVALYELFERVNFILIYEMCFVINKVICIKLFI